MAVRRRLMVFLAIVSLGLFVFAGVSLAFSVPVDDEDVRGLAFDGHGAAAGSRAVVIPIRYSPNADPVATFASGVEGHDGIPGALLALGTSGGIFPTTATNVSFARALVFLPGGAHENESISFENVPMRDVQGNETFGNLTFNLSALPPLIPGFLVKADGDDAPRFVAVAEVLGEVARFDPPGRMVTFLMVGLVGFIAPVIGLIATHGGAGTPGVGGQGVCRECRTTLSPPSEFCLRCGALNPQEESPDA